MSTTNLSNPIRPSFLFFINDLIGLLNDQNQYSLKSLETKLDIFSKTSIKLLSKTVEPGLIEHLNNSLKSEISLILDYAKNVQNNGLVNKQQLSHDIFGGIPLPIEPLSQSSFDIIIEETPTRSKAIVYCPLTTEVYDKLEIQVAAEKASHLPCLNVEIKYQIPELNDSITPKAVTVVTPTEVNDESSEPIGRCVFAKSSPMQLSTTPVKDSIKAVVYESFAHSVRPNDLLKLVSDDKTKSVYCQI